MITHVLVPIDDSELSIRAVPVAGALADLTGATVDLVTIEPLGWAQGLDEQRLQDVGDLVPPGVEVTRAIVPTTDSVATTLAHLDHPAGTILCLATHGRGPLASLGLGSVTANLVAHAVMPVLVVGPGCTSPAPSDLGGTVLAAVDGCDHDEDVLAAAARWARVTGSALVITTTITRPSAPEAWVDANHVLADARAGATRLGIGADVLPVAAADVEEGILRAVEPGTGCIVMGSHRRGRLGRLLFGSTTAAVLRRAPCPVLVAGPRPAAGHPPAPVTTAPRREDDEVATRRSGLSRMDRAECLALLEAEDVGRLAVVQGNVPAIFPVNYLLDGEDVVFRSAAGTKVAHGAGAPAAFEIDHLDREARQGWSVVAIGRLELVDDSDGDLWSRLRALPIRPWAAGERDILMRLVVGTITGRLLGGPDATR